MTATDPDAHFTSSRSPAGFHAVEVRASGEIDMATAPRLDEMLRAAVAAAPLTVLTMQDVSFLDGSGLRVILGASKAARRATHRLVVLHMRADVAAIFTWTGTLAELDVVGGWPGSSWPGDAWTMQDAITPPENPVNAAVLGARVMAVPDRQLWLQAADGGVQRAWAPDPLGGLASPDRPVKVYVDELGAINGWWDPVSGLAVNQRHLDRTAPPATGDPMTCQGRCGLVWQAPAAAQLQEYDEQCLTCAGRLAPG